MTWRRIPSFRRRALLAGLGASAALAPFLPMLEASGEEPGLPRRLVLFFTPHGTIFDRWVPTGTETSFALSPILAPLERFKEKLVIVDGMGIDEGVGPGAPHTKGPPLLWTASPLLMEATFTREDGSGGPVFGWNSAPSVDQVIASRLMGTTPFPSLELGVRSGGGFPGAHMIYSGPRAPVAPVQDPNAMFDTLFGDALRPAAEAERIRRERRAVLDLVQSELRPLATRVAREDRRKIEQHLESIASLEASLAPRLSACTPPGRPGDRGTTDDVPWTLDRQIEILAAALTCDLTRVASLQYRVGENDGITYPWLGLAGVEHHITTHSSDATSLDQLTTIYTWYADRFAYLLERLDAVPEGDGTMLDHTLVLWGSELGTGQNHSFERVPFVVAGGGLHGVRTGRFQTLSSAKHNRLLVSALQFMGDASASRFGSTDTGSGGLPGLLAP